MRADVWCSGSRWVTTILFMTGPLGLAGCGGESRSAHESAAFDRLGVECGEVGPVTGAEVILDDTAPECGGGYCLHSEDVARGAHQSAGMCSCRCDGPAGTGPFCACGDGFECREQVRALGVTSSELSGSYCVPAP